MTDLCSVKWMRAYSTMAKIPHIFTYLTTWLAILLDKLKPINSMPDVALSHIRVSFFSSLCCGKCGFCLSMVFASVFTDQLNLSPLSSKSQWKSVKEHIITPSIVLRWYNTIAIKINTTKNYDLLWMNLLLCDGLIFNFFSETSFHLDNDYSFHYVSLSLSLICNNKSQYKWIDMNIRFSIAMKFWHFTPSDYHSIDMLH